MRWNKRQKAYAAILLAAAAALITDRTLFDGRLDGASTAEAASQAPGAKPARSAPTSRGGSARDSRYDTLAARLELLRGSTSQADPFQSPFEHAPAPSSPEAAPEPRAPTFDIPAFTAQHRLTAVMLGKSGSCAMINGKLVRIGDSLGGLTLTAVDGQTALFEGAGVKITLVAGQSEPR